MNKKQFKYFVIPLAAVILCACNFGQSEKQTTKLDTAKNYTSVLMVNKPEENKIILENDTSAQEEAYANYFIVISDTSSNYFKLHQQLFELNKILNLPIDTLGRTLHPTKKIIALPDTAPDEIYAGEYFPRRELDENLSLEYLNFYQPKSKKKTIALVTGIYVNETSADRALKILKK